MLKTGVRDELLTTDTVFKEIQALCSPVLSLTSALFAYMFAYMVWQVTKTCIRDD